MDISIREGQTEDLDSVARIEKESYSNPWHPDTFRSLLKRDKVVVLVAEEAGKGVVGFTVFWWVLDQGELANLAVRRDRRGRGIGSALLDQVLLQAAGEGVASLFLEVRVSNQPAQKLYASRGFTRISVRKDYYQNPREDALILVKMLSTGSSPSTTSAGGSKP